MGKGESIFFFYHSFASPINSIKFIIIQEFDLISSIFILLNLKNFFFSKYNNLKVLFNFEVIKKYFFNIEFLIQIIQSFFYLTNMIGIVKQGSEFFNGDFNANIEIYNLS